MAAALAPGDTGHRGLAFDDDNIVPDIAAFEIDLLAFQPPCGATGPRGTGKRGQAV